MCAPAATGVPAANGDRIIECFGRAPPISLGGRISEVSSRSLNHYEWPMNSSLETTQEDALHASPRRLNRLLNELRASSYLEIGVCDGHTFFAVEVSERTGVDPQFRFDWKDRHNGNEVVLVNEDSDTFFANLPVDKKYDVIFVDGLHTYDQTYRDIQNALLHSHSRSVMLIDDTVPSDVFSTCREMQECLHLRSRFTGSADPRWHGDTYKVIPLLAVFNSGLSYVTLMTGGNPQTLLWRSGSSLPEDPMRMMQGLWALDNLASCDFLWLARNMDLYMPTSEEDGLARVIAELMP